MTRQITADNLSRIDKLFLDQQGVDIDEAKRRRTSHGLKLIVGDELDGSSGLQLSLLTAINLGVKCFGGNVKVHLSAKLSNAPCLSPVCTATTLVEAIGELGGEVVYTPDATPTGPHLVLGSSADTAEGIRVTYDGWRVCVGPVALVPRLAEREYCPLASIAAAAIAVGEIFAEFAGLSILATRRVIDISLWRPDLPGSSADAPGLPLQELPKKLAVFGLGHLGQAYLWGLASLPYSAGSEVEFLLCDDDQVEVANVETGALLELSMVGQLKTRVASSWLEKRGFRTKLLERRVDEKFRRTEKEPAIALSGFDNNEARQCLASAGFNAIFDSGLGGDAHNFDTVGFHSWPNPREVTDLWLLKSATEKAADAERLKKKAGTNAGYLAMKKDECGRLILAGKSVAVPFVGALAACFVLAEMAKSVNGHPTYFDITIRLCSLGSIGPISRLNSYGPPPIRGVATVPVEN